MNCQYLLLQFHLLELLDSYQRRTLSMFRKLRKTNWNLFTCAIIFAAIAHELSIVIKLKKVVKLLSQKRKPVPENVLHSFHTWDEALHTMNFYNYEVERIQQLQYSTIMCSSFINDKNYGSFVVIIITSTFILWLYYQLLLNWNQILKFEFKFLPDYSIDNETFLIFFSAQINFSLLNKK
jgi:hypothetical protein